MSSRPVEGFLSDLMFSLSVHQHREAIAIWPDDGEAVAAETLTELGDGTTAGIVSGLSALIGAPVAAAVAAPPVRATADSDLILMPLRGSCRVGAGGGFGLRLLAGEVVFVPRGAGYACADPRGDCRLLMLRWEAERLPTPAVALPPAPRSALSPPRSALSPPRSRA